MKKIYTLMIISLLAAPAMASGGDKITQSNDNNAQTTGDVNIAGDSSKAFGIGHALGDVDINQCLGSEQWGTPIVSKQKLVINWPCMAEFYLKNGAPELAAMALCNTEILDEFADETECETAHQFLSAIEPAAASPIEDTHLDEEEEFHEEVLLKIAMLEEEINKPAPAPVRKIYEQHGLTDEQKAALREVTK